MRGTISFRQSSQATESRRCQKWTTRPSFSKDDLTAGLTFTLGQWKDELVSSTIPRPTSGEVHLHELFWKMGFTFSFSSPPRAPFKDEVHFRDQGVDRDLKNRRVGVLCSITAATARACGEGDCWLFVPCAVLIETLSLMQCLVSA